jgi:hypothetical protein
LDNSIIPLNKRFISLNDINSDLSIGLAGQILSFRFCFKEEITKRTSVRAITELLVIENYTSTITFSEICTAYDIFNIPRNSYYNGTFIFKIKINKKIFTEHNA